MGHARNVMTSYYGKTTLLSQTNMNNILNIVTIIIFLNGYLDRDHVDDCDLKSIGVPLWAYKGILCIGLRKRCFVTFVLEASDRIENRWDLSSSQEEF